MSWLGKSLGDSVSSLTGQLSNLTKDILTEGTEEVSDHATELSLAKEQIINLEGTQTTLRIENDRLKRLVRELEEKAESAELQINSISRQYRTQLEEKEREINELKQRQHELLEQHAKQAALNVPGDVTYSDTARDTELQPFQEGFEDWSNESWGDFDDSLRLQREINLLRQEVTRLRADSQHWRSVAGQLSQQDGRQVDQSAHHDLLNLQAKVKELEKTVSESREQAQNEVASLQDIHHNKTAALKKRHKDEVTQLKSQLTSLEQQLADVRDGDSSGAGGSSSVLPESERAESELEKSLWSQLIQVTEHKDKAQAAKTQLEGMLEELQTEVESLHSQRDDLHAKVTDLEDRLLSEEQDHEQQVESLRSQLEEAEACRVRAEERGNEESKLKSSIAETGTQLQQMSSDTETLIDQLGSEESLQKAAAEVNKMERDNLVLREQCLKLEEQITLLEKRSANQQEEWQHCQATIKDLRRELKQYRGETATHSDDTLDQSLSSYSDPHSPCHTSSPSDQDPSLDWEVQKEALEEILAQLRRDVRQKDEQISLLSTTGKEKDEQISLLSAKGKEKDDQISLLSMSAKEKDEQISLSGATGRQTESTEDVTSLKTENARLLSELSSVREEKEELETSIGELDEQHEEATTHLISARNALQAQLADSQRQVLSLQDELDQLRQQPSTPDSSPAPQDLQQELHLAQQQVTSLRREADARDAELSELKTKLQKGTLALNDLHMDKKDLEEQVARGKEEVKAKVETIKALREEKTRLMHDNRELSERLQEMEEEVEMWEQRNEQAQLDKGEAQRLQEQLDSLQAEHTAQQQKLDAMFLELDQSRSECRKLQDRETHEGDEMQALAQERDHAVHNKDKALQERDKALQGKEKALEERDIAQQEKEEYLLERNMAIEEKENAEVKMNNVLQERDMAIEEKEKAKVKLTNIIQERDTAIQERDQAIEKVSQLELQCSTVVDKPTHPHPHSAASVEELQTQITSPQQQLESSVRDSSALQEEIVRIKSETVSQDSAHCDDLRGHHQHIAEALQKRCTALNRLKTDWSHRSRSGHIESESSETGQFSRDAVLELCQESRTLLDALVSGNSILEEMQQQYCAGLSHIDTMSVQKHVSNLHSLPSQGSQSDTDVTTFQAEHQRMVEVVRDKDTELGHLRQSLTHLQQDHAACRDSVDSLSEKVLTMETVISEKDSELNILHTENDQLMKICEESKSKLKESDTKIASLKSQLEETESALQQAEGEVKAGRLTLEEMTEASAVHIDLKQELDSARHKIDQLEQELSQTVEILSHHKTSLEELNAKYAEQTKCLEREQAQSSKQANMIAVLQQTSNTVDEELETVKRQLNQALKHLTDEQRDVILDKSQDFADSVPSLPSIQSDHIQPLEMTPSAKREQSSLQNGEAEPQDSGRQSDLAKKHDVLLQQLQEKEEVIADLQQNNTTLLQMLEAKTLSSQSGDNAQLEVHRLQSEVKALKVEKEQMLAIMNDKSREASSLKAEVMRLMSVVSAEKSALDKLQKDNQELMSRSSPPRDDSLEDMTREAMQNLSRLVRDREMEIEALKQKNETLMAVLQDMNQGEGASQGPGPSLASQLMEKENLEKQLASLQAEREQMVVFVNQKHSESVTYHAEIQRLAALRAEEMKSYEKLQSDYDTLCPQFEDKNQTLLKAQNDLINYRQKYAELEVRYGELLQKSNASETVDAASFNEVKEEKERLVTKCTDLQQDIQIRENKHHTLTEKLKETEISLADRESEASALKKQVDSFHFQLQSLRNEMADVKQEKEVAEQRHAEWQEQGQTLKDLNSQLTLSVREKEFEVASLQERVQKLTVLVSEQQGEKTQVSQLLKEHEHASELRGELQQEVDQLTLTLKQRQQQLNDMHAENLRLKEREQKLSRELDRLRSHLLQIEEGYTREALEAEEREKVLRNRLAHAEEQLASTASQVQSASHQASQQVESLQQQLHSLASQRDAAYMQVASLQDQCQQYSSSLSNLQLVLEQFQRDKDSLVSSETERYQEETRRLRERTTTLETELAHTKEELEEASDGLAAASRLSEQLDKKEEALQVMRDEVQNRETALRTAEEEIHKLKSSKEAKVDRELMKNLLLGYFHTPDRNRMDAIHAIGSVLGFSQSDFHKIEEGQGGGWVSGLLRRVRTPGTTPPTTPLHPAKKTNPNQSFSQLFVKFLEVESTPPPAPVRLPAEEMAREATERHHVKEWDARDKTPFNPFTAPRHVSMPIPVGSAASVLASAAPHPLMAPPPSSPTTTFPVFTPFSSSDGGSTPKNSSAILKDVLGTR